MSLWDWLNISTLAYNFGVPLVMLGTAVYGFLTWKRQFLGKEKFIVARNLLRVTEKLQNAIEAFRHNHIKNEEFPSHYNQLSGCKAEMALFAHAYGNRLKSVWSLRKEFNDAVLEAELLRMDKIKPSVEKIRSCTEDLYMAHWNFAENDRSNGQLFSNDPDLREETLLTVGKIRKRNSTGISATDEFAKIVQNAVAEIKRHVRRHT